MLRRQMAMRTSSQVAGHCRHASVDDCHVVPGTVESEAKRWRWKRGAETVLDSVDYLLLENSCVWRSLCGVCHGEVRVQCTVIVLDLFMVIDRDDARRAESGTGSVLAVLRRPS